MVGWDAADWKIIHKLCDRGVMPYMKSLLQQGASGNLSTLEPILSPMLWTSIATGKRPFKHGIHGFTEPLPDGSGIRPSTSTSRTCKAVWNMLMQEQYKVHVLGWFSSHPAEPINGVYVSDLFYKSSTSLDEPWPLAEGAACPPEPVELLKSGRAHPDEMTAEAVVPFIPRVAEIDIQKDKRLKSCRRLLAECSTIHNVATWVLENQEWDFIAVFYDAIDHFGHAFMHYYPPRREQVSEKDYELYKNVIDSVYVFQDLQLGRLLHLAGDDVTLILVSDHGYHSDHLRPEYTPDIPAGPAVWHRPVGVSLVKGPGIKQNATMYGANVLDVTPTILQLCGLPLGKDMDGHPWLQAMENPGDVALIDSWEDRPGNSGEHDPDKKENAVDAHEALQQLVALGYIDVDAPGENIQKTIDNTVNESRYNLARSYMDAGLYWQAIPILQKLIEKDGEAPRFRLTLASAFQGNKQIPESRRELEQLCEKHQKSPPSVLVMLAALYREEGDVDNALKWLDKITLDDLTQPELCIRYGANCGRLGKVSEAESAYLKALKLDPDSRDGVWGMTRVCLRKKDYQQALDYALRGAELAPYFALTHYYMGRVLLRLNKYRESTTAFQRAIELNPGLYAAHRFLALIYRLYLNDPVKSTEHRLIAQKKLKRRIAGQ